MKSSFFWDIMFCSFLKVESRALPATCVDASFVLSYSSTLKMEVTCSFETLGDFQWTTSHYILEDRTLELIVVTNFVRNMNSCFLMNYDDDWQSCGFSP